MTTISKQRLIDLLEQLNRGLVERESALRAALLAVLAGENLLLVGPPGTAKSLIARRVAGCLAPEGGAGDYFEYLLTKFSTPEEIFGPLSISELKADRFKRNTTGYLPTVRLAFLDEIFKASSSILNALLTILNERLYHNGATAENVPLQAIIAASNELPTGQEELEALYDRFLVRSFVDYVSAENLPRLFDRFEEAPLRSPLKASDLQDIRQAAADVSLPAEIVTAITRIWTGHKQLFKADSRENLSDRRLKKAVGLLRVSAATNGRTEVDLSDLLLLKDCLWNHPDNAIKIRELVLSTLRGFSRPVPKSEAGKSAETGDRSKTTQQQQTTQSDAVVKGFKGRGTESDPILIATLHELAGLDRAEVGQQGYWFRQTADIDLSNLTTWPVLVFQGHYDGDGHTTSVNGGARVLFNKVLPNSTLINLRLENLSLARTVSDSQISSCSSSEDLIREDATNCQIFSCDASGCLIADGPARDIKRKAQGAARKCTISNCRSGSVLIAGSAVATTIRDCLAHIRHPIPSGFPYSLGGIASEVKDSLVERCFVFGKISEAPSSGFISFPSTSKSFSGIAGLCDRSTIRQCALGSLELTRDQRSLKSRITGEISRASPLINNIALDANLGISDLNGRDGKSLPAALFAQHYFEHTLEWDFETVWNWNEVHQLPELLSVGIGAALVGSGQSDRYEDMLDLLAEQLHNNLWV